MIAVAAGTDHSLVVGGDGLVYGAGANYMGQLTGTAERKRFLSMLTGLPGGVRATATDGGNSESIVLGDDGVAYSSGFGDFDRVNHATLDPLVGLPTGVRANAVAAGDCHLLVLGDDGRVYGEGCNEFGQLTGAAIERTILTRLKGLPIGVKATAVAAGGYTSLVVGDNGMVYGAGDNEIGQITGMHGEKRTLSPLSGLPTGVKATDVAIGCCHSLVVGDDGQVYGAGWNENGQLTGTDPTKSTLTPFTGLPAGVRASAVAAATQHSLVVADDGVAYGTGSNRNGQITGTDARSTLTPLTGLPPAVHAVLPAARGSHSLVVGSDGIAYGTGNNVSGQLTGAVKKKSTLTPLVWGIANNVVPRITGTPRLHQTLTARYGQWWPTPTSYTYIWFRNGDPIPGATSKAHLVAARDLGTRLKVKVTAERSGYHSGSKTTVPVAVVGP